MFRFMKYLQKFKTAISLSINHFILKKTPVLVYASGRVGSISMIHALKTVGIFTIKVEWLDFNTRGTVRFCKKHIVDKRKPAKVITLVRDPVEILSSLFFSKSCRGHLPLGYAAVQEKNVEKLHKAFETEILNGKHLLNHLHWFEQEFRPHLDIDVFAFYFNPAKKFGTITDKTYPTLILRTDLPDVDKETQVRNFLNINKFNIGRLNVKSDRKKGDLYEEFIAKLKISSDWLDTIYNSNYAQHFFSEEEIRSSKEKYSK
jgi:hypothetical protein